jgi:release factor glutamine methyltransferase
LSNNEPWTVGRLLQWTAVHLRDHGVENPRLDAEVLLAHARTCERIDLYAAFGEVADDGVRANFRDLIRMRTDGTPVAYLVGHREFYSLSFLVNKDVLIPRPETERLVEVVLSWAADRDDLEALDVGTGSGAIALSLLTEGAFVRCVGTDAAATALEFATRNRDSMDLGSRLELRLGTLFEPIVDGERFDVVVSNPPYIAEVDRATVQAEVAEWEPEVALFAGVDGLDMLREIVRGAPQVLRGGGLLALEVGDGQAAAVVALVEGSGAYRDARVHEDLAGKTRIVTAARAQD